MACLSVRGERGRMGGGRGKVVGFYADGVDGLVCMWTWMWVFFYNLFKSINVRFMQACVLVSMLVILFRR